MTLNPKSVLFRSITNSAIVQRIVYITSSITSAKRKSDEAETRQEEIQEEPPLFI